jgi:hypothetical protein
MGKKLSPKENKLYKRVDETLFYLWDPIGVCDVPHARDEYYSFLPAIFKLVLNGVAQKEIADELINIQEDQLSLATVSRGKDEKVAGILLAYRSIIYGDAT